LTKKPIEPQADEIAHNPRARSAKLRFAARVSD
jgi:16S rRNA C1402 N4-methylase RsmH